MKIAVQSLSRTVFPVDATSNTITDTAIKTKPDSRCLAIAALRRCTLVFDRFLG